ncbi:MAG: DUF349 domain-containing protein [Flavobacteriaceae bacterium]
MAKKNPQPSAEENNEPQTERTEFKQVEKSEKNEITEVSEVSKKKTASKAKKKDADTLPDDESETQSEAPSKKEEKAEGTVDYSNLPIEELVSTYAKLSTDQQWLKNQKELQSVQQTFEEKFQKDVEIKKKTFLKEGGNEIDFFYKPDFKSEFDQFTYEFRKKRRQFYKEQETTQKVNLERRKAIIEEIKSLISIDQNINTTYKTFKTLQESWYSTGQVPRNQSTNLWETYKHHVERFYDFLHLNRELRELDFKHNYEEKLKIIEKAEALIEETDIIKASRDLNTLHQLWKNDLGPVAKEHREELWKRFQTATKTIQKKRQDLQKEIVDTMRENLDKKGLLLNEMNALTKETPQSHKAWQNAIKRFNSLREEFKNVGYIPAKESKASWLEFREIGREFMRTKNEFYKIQKEEYNKNIDAKQALIKQSENLLESENWQQASQQMKDLQKEWKRVGFVPRKLDNKLWKKFSDLHEVYFDRLKSGYQKLSESQEAIQQKKLAFIENLKVLTLPEDIEALKVKSETLTTEWQQFDSIGESLDQQHTLLFVSTLIKKIKNLSLDKNDLNSVLDDLDKRLIKADPKRLQKEMQTVKSTISELKSELTQLQNNLSFFSDSSTENPLFKNVEKQIEKSQKKMDQAQAEYIRLKQLKNENEKQDQKVKNADIDEVDNENN